MDVPPISSNGLRLSVPIKCGVRIEPLSACSSSLCIWRFCWMSFPEVFGDGNWLYESLPADALDKDVFPRSIRGWELAGHMMEELPKAALSQALSQHRPEIHPSDQGVQYAVSGSVSLLQDANVQISMSARGRPTENAYIERFMRTLKEEEVYLHDSEDLQDARTHITRFLEEGLHVQAGTFLVRLSHAC